MTSRPEGADKSNAGTVTVEVVDDLHGEFAERVVEAFHYRTGPNLTLGLTGGPCAAACYERLATFAETQIDWWHIDLWWVDELRLGPDDPGSHQGMVRRHLLNQVGAAYALHPLPTDDTPERLDFVHLDLGTDGRLSWLDADDRLSLPLDLLARSTRVLVTAEGLAGSETIDRLVDRLTALHHPFEAVCITDRRI